MKRFDLSPQAIHSTRYYDYNYDHKELYTHLIPQQIKNNILKTQQKANWKHNQHTKYGESKQSCNNTETTAFDAGERTYKSHTSKQWDTLFFVDPLPTQ